VHILLFQVKLYKKEERAMWNPPGLPIMPGLLRYRGLAVVYYSGIPCALHRQHAQQSLNSSKIILCEKSPVEGTEHHRVDDDAELFDLRDAFEE